MTDTAFYSRLAATSNHLLKGKGQAVTLTHVTPGTYNPATGGVTNTTQTQTGFGVVMEWDARYIDGTLILATDRQLILSPLNSDGVALTPPALGDTVAIGGVNYTIVSPLNTVAPAGPVVLYEANIRA